MARVAKEIGREVSGWPVVEARPHRLGGTGFRARDHEIGHVHGGGFPGQADLPFPRRVREDLVASGRASLHHLLPETGWVTYYIEDEDGTDRAVELFRLNYDRLTRRRAPTVEERLARHGDSPG